MAQPRGSRRKRRWLLANVIGGVVILVVLSFALSGSPGSSEGRSAGSALQSDSSRDATQPGSCTQFQQMVAECANPTSTTTTAAPGSSPSGGGGGGGTTTSSSQAGVLGSTGQPGASAPAAPSASSAASPGAPFLSADPGGPCSGTAPPVAAPSGGWRCTFDDEFNGTSLDTSKWSPMLTYGTAFRTGPVFNQVCYVDSPQTISESGGYLDLSIVETAQPYRCQGTSPGGNQTNQLGGMVISYQKFAQEYGFFETRASMPPTDFPGLQETLWLYPEDETLYGPWPDSGEIDYGEFYSEYPNNDIPAVHYPGSDSDPNAESNNCVIAGSTTTGQFHTYALLWTPTTLTAYYDGKTCITDVYAPYVNNPDTAPEPFNQPFFLNLTSALGSTNGDQYRPGQTPLPATMQIDWTRVWEFG